MGYTGSESYNTNVNITEYGYIHANYTMNYIDCKSTHTRFSECDKNTSPNMVVNCGLEDGVIVHCVGEINPTTPAKVCSKLSVAGNSQAAMSGTYELVNEFVNGGRVYAHDDGYKMFQNNNTWMLDPTTGSTSATKSTASDYTTSASATPYGTTWNTGAIVCCLEFAEVRDDCADINKYCPNYMEDEWACDYNVDFMHENCPASCMRCTTTIPSEDSTMSLAATLFIFLYILFN